MKYPYCESDTNDFISINQTVGYSGVEIAVNRQGMLRARIFDTYDNLISQDVVEIHNCPLCGKQFMKG